MIVVLAPRAHADLTEIYDYLAERSLPVARATVERIYERLDQLVRLPEIGRVGRIAGTRELVIPGTPYLAVYELDLRVRVLRILHGAQQWPNE